MVKRSWFRLLGMGKRVPCQRVDGMSIAKLDGQVLTKCLSPDAWIRAGGSGIHELGSEFFHGAEGRPRISIALRASKAAASALQMISAAKPRTAETIGSSVACTVGPGNVRGLLATAPPVAVHLDNSMMTII